MTDDLFNPDLTPDPAPKIDNYLTELVGEQKKFKTPEELARGKWESDNYIKILERQRDEMRVDLNKYREDTQAAAKLETLLAKLEKAPIPSSSDMNPSANDVLNTPVVNPVDVEALVTKKYQEIETAKKQRENFNLVQSKLKEKYGANYAPILQERIDTLGLDKNYFNDLAKNYPQVVLTTLGLDQPAMKEEFQSPPRGSVRSDNFVPRGAEKRTWSHYQALKAQNPKLYFDPKTTVQMEKDALAMGQDFFDE